MPDGESDFQKARVCYCHLVCFNCNNYLPQISRETCCLSLVFCKSKEQLMTPSFPQMFQTACFYRRCCKGFAQMFQCSCDNGTSHPPALPQELMALLLTTWRTWQKIWTPSMEAISQQFDFAQSLNLAAKPLCLGSMWDKRKSNNYWGTTGYTQKTGCHHQRTECCFIAAYSSCPVDVVLPLFIMEISHPFRLNFPNNHFAKDKMPPPPSRLHLLFYSVDVLWPTLPGGFSAGG